MAALTANKNVREKQSAFSQLVGDFGSSTPNSSSVFYLGSMLAYDTSDDTIKPAATSTTLIALGRCEEEGAAGDLDSVRVRSGVFKFENNGSSISNSDSGSDCYIVDDQSVDAANGGGTRSVAGKVVSVDSDGVWVAINPLV